ncbi:MAG TPA: YbaB/EbfC family nucleoid-associated protein [Candidatus Sulfotelmatobacter sp.]|nr:YbaB/EbfC family nucleoid-associated protein [Candidatus Sulfotelmatobacter sp.]
MNPNQMRQLQKLQQEMQKAQEDIQNATAEGTAAGGAVTVAISGDFRVSKVTLKPEVVDPADVEMLEDLLVVALADAHKKIEEFAAKRMSAATGGMRIPGM